MYILHKFLNYLNIYNFNKNIINSDYFLNKNKDYNNYLESGLFYYFYKISLDDIEKGLFNYDNITIFEKNII